MECTICTRPIDACLYASFLDATIGWLTSAALDLHRRRAKPKSKNRNGCQDIEGYVEALKLDLFPAVEYPRYVPLFFLTRSLALC